ncbi:hypothetical protein [Succinimonas sp.]|uniref:hypothetical protein n=1 Tax=Succinimonas sp. TaxID=1936151 RepID=UPI003863E3EF
MKNEEQDQQIVGALKKKESELAKSKEIVKTLKTLLSSKEVYLDALMKTPCFKTAGTEEG